MSWPAILLWIAILASAASTGPALLYLLMIGASFGSLQMLPGSGGGANLLPQSTCAAVFVCKVLAQRGNMTRGIEAALDPQRLLLFSAFLIYSIIGALVLPRMFSGMFEVVPVSAFRFGTDILRPSPGNFTQTCYMMLSYATTLSFTIVGQSQEIQKHYRRALLCGAYALIGTGFLDLVAFTFHLEALLDPFRTASYTMLTDVEVQGAKRVVGLMPEASSFGSACVGTLSLILFMRPLYRSGAEQILATVALLLLALMTMLSTSSTAIVGFGVLIAVYGADLLVRMLDPSNSRRDQLNIEISIIVLVLFFAFVGFVMKPSLFDPIISMVDKMVFQKTNSDSYAERSLWNRVGWQAFLDSGGIGTGLGSIRVSNWAISILGSTGILGATLLFGYIIQQLVAAPRTMLPGVKIYSTVTKLGIIPILAMFQLSATTPDIGITTAFALGIITAAHMIQSNRPRSLKAPSAASTVVS